MPHYGVAVVRWRLNTFLEARSITVYRLHQELGDELSRTALYNIARGDTHGLDFATLAHLITALRHLTGETVTPSDLIEYLPSDIPNGRER